MLQVGGRRHLDSRYPIIQVGDKSGRNRVSKESLTGSPSSSLSPAPAPPPTPHPQSPLGLFSTLAQIFRSPPLSENLEQASIPHVRWHERDPIKCALFNPWHHAVSIRCQTDLQNGPRPWLARPISVFVPKLPSSHNGTDCFSPSMAKVR